MQIIVKNKKIIILTFNLLEISSSWCEIQQVEQITQNYIVRNISIFILNIVMECVAIETSIFFHSFLTFTSNVHLPNDILVKKKKKK